MADQPRRRPRWICAHCGRASGGHKEAIVRDARGRSTPLCHPSQDDLPDCYRRVTVYGEPLGVLRGSATQPIGVQDIRRAEAR